jgi:hypothetical protein
VDIPYILPHVLWNDEEVFTGSGIHSLHNLHIWAMDNGQQFSSPFLPCQMHNWLNRNFLIRMAACGAFITWPPHPPNVTHPHFDLGGRLKEKGDVMDLQECNNLINTIEESAHTTVTIRNSV